MQGHPLEGRGRSGKEGIALDVDTIMWFPQPKNELREPETNKRKCLQNSGLRSYTTIEMYVAFYACNIFFVESGKGEN